MSARRFPSQPDDMLRRLGSQVVPVEDPARVQRRRELVVASLARTIRENAEHKRRVLRARVLWGVGLAASLAIAVGFAAHVQQRTVSSTLATVADVRGAVVVTEGGESRVLSHGSKLELSAVGEIETALEAQAEIRSRKSVLHIGPATKLTVPQATTVEERYRLALGRVDVSVDKDSRITRSVVVETPNAEVVVHGTVFAVGVAAHSGHKVTEVSVTRGSVWVLANGVQVAVLGPGQHWSSEVEPSVGMPMVPEVPPATAAEPDTKRDSATHPVHREATPAEVKASTLAEQSRSFQEAIDARNRGDDVHAAESFTRLLARYPNYEEAQVQLFRAQNRLGRAAAAAAEARRYLALHPQGFAHEEARTLALSSGATQPR